MQELLAYCWPGNIRELEHVIERSVIWCKGNIIQEVLLPKVTIANFLQEQKVSYIKTIAQNERDHIVSVLKITKGRVRGNGGAAQLLDIHPNTLEFRMRKPGIEKEVMIKG